MVLDGKRTWTAVRPQNLATADVFVDPGAIEHPNQQTFLRVHAITGLPDHVTLRAVDDFIGDLLAADGGQTVQHPGVSRRGGATRSGILGADDPGGPRSFPGVLATGPQGRIGRRHALFRERRAAGILPR